MSDDWRFPTAYKEVPSMTSDRTSSAVNPPPAPELYDSAKLIAEIERLRALVGEMREALRHVLGWVDAWEPEFVQDEEWQEHNYYFRDAIAKADEVLK